MKEKCLRSEPLTDNHISPIFNHSLVEPAVGRITVISPSRRPVHRFVTEATLPAASVTGIRAPWAAFRERDTMGRRGLLTVLNAPSIHWACRAWEEAGECTPTARVCEDVVPVASGEPADQLFGEVLTWKEDHSRLRRVIGVGKWRSHGHCDAEE